MTSGGRERRARLAGAALYLITDAQPGGRALSELLEAALPAGVDIVQLRDKQLGDDDLLAAAATVREHCDRHGALFILNDRPDLAAAADADGAHIGQDDVAPARARELLGPERLMGISTHDSAQIDRAIGAGADYVGVGPVNATPTKPGRPAVGLDLVRHAAATASIPFFAIGGIDTDNVGEVARTGATRIAVVRALTESDDPAAAAAELRAGLGLEAGVGAT